MINMCFPLFFFFCEGTDFLGFSRLVKNGRNEKSMGTFINRCTKTGKKVYDSFLFMFLLKLGEMEHFLLKIERAREMLLATCGDSLWITDSRSDPLLFQA